MNKKIEKINCIKVTDDVLNFYEVKAPNLQHATNLLRISKLNELIEVVNSLKKDENKKESKPS